MVECLVGEVSGVVNGRSGRVNEGLVTIGWVVDESCGRWICFD